MPIATTDQFRAPRRRLIAIGLAAAVVAGGILVVLLTRAPDEPTQREAIAPPPTPDAAVVAKVEDAAVPPPVVPDAPELPKKITVRVTSKPSGAEIRVAGKLLGKSPIDVPLDRGSADVAIEARIGARAVTKTVVPDADRSLELAVPVPATIRPSGDKVPF